MTYRQLRSVACSRPVVAVTVVAGVMMASGMPGCAAPTSSEGRWSRQAADVARTRLTDAQGGGVQQPSPGGDEVSGPRTRALSNGASNGGSFAGVRELSLARVVADEPAPQAPAESPPDAASATTRPSGRAPVDRDPLPSFTDTVVRDIKAMPRVLWEDTVKVYTDPYNVLFLVGMGGASIALRYSGPDDTIASHYDDHHAFKEDWRDAFGALGNPATHFAMAGVWYLAGQQMQDAKTYQVGKQLFSALTVTGLSTMFLKVCANDHSPNGESLAWPSGHVSSTIAMATVLNDAYGPVVGAPMFGLTALVAVERLDDGEHWFSDVVFGAALGWVVSETIMKEHRPEVFGGDLVPYVDPMSNNAGIAWVKTLGN